MADLFGDPSLFEEFEKDREPANLLLTKIENHNGNVKVPNNGEVPCASNASRISKEDCLESESLARNGVTETETTSFGSRIGKSHSKEIDDLKRHIDKLTTENVMLKKRLRVIHTQKFNLNDCGPILQVLFMNQAASRSIREKIEPFIQSVLFEESSSSSNQPPSLSNKYSAVYTGDVDQSAEDAVNQNSPHVITGSSQMYSQFSVDTIGWPLVAYNTSVTDGWFLPTYTQFFKEALPADEEDEDGQKAPQRRKKPKASCFNCGGDHILSKCTLPKDLSKITKNRTEFMANNTSSPPHMNTSRYHASDDPRFSKFKPGVISPELRKALGIEPLQLPLHIYRMRNLGYPPGHLEDAKALTSGLSMFDKHGKETNMRGQSLEEGEVDEEQTNNTEMFNPEKIIDYPGFNVPPPSGTYDDYRRLGMPPMLPLSSKENMIRRLSQGTPVVMGKKRKSVDANEGRGGKRQRQDIDMDISDGEDGPPSPGSMVILDSITDNTSACETPPPHIKTSTKVNQVKFSDSPASPETSTPKQNRPSVDSPASPLQTPVREHPLFQHTPSSGGSLQMNFGTPLVLDSTLDKSADLSDSIKRGKCLPDSSKFAKGIQEHLNFDNLPNSTGSFAKLRKVIKAVRRGSS